MTRITATKTDIDSESIKELYAERAISRAGVDVDAPVVLASDSDPEHIREWNEHEVKTWLPQLKLDQNSRVLELGFGTGRIAKFLIVNIHEDATGDYKPVKGFDREF